MNVIRSNLNKNNIYTWIMANKYIWCVEIYVFDVQLGYTNTDIKWGFVAVISFREISCNYLIAKVYSTKFTKIVQPRKFFPAKSINFAVRLIRESFFQRNFLPLKYVRKKIENRQRFLTSYQILEKSVQPIINDLEGRTNRPTNILTQVK